MSEWHLPPDLIVNNWTEELLDLMIEKLTERKKREREAMQGGSEDNTVREKVSDKELFRVMGQNVKVEKRGD